MDLDNLSIILIIFEGIIIGGIIASILIAGKKLLEALPIMSTGLKIVTSIMFAGILLITFAVKLATLVLNVYLIRLQKEFKFYFAYTKFVVLQETNTIKQYILENLTFKIKSFKDLVISRGSPHILIRTGDLSSQSYLRISPVILQ